jgi:hypothetical protein
MSAFLVADLFRQDYASCASAVLLDLRGVEDYNAGQGGLWQDPKVNAQHKSPSNLSKPSPSRGGLKGERVFKGQRPLISQDSPS